MKKQELRKIIKEELKDVLKEGTWALPKTRTDGSIQAKKFINKIEKLKDEIYNVFGDDTLFDHFDGAIKRIKELVKLIKK